MKKPSCSVIIPNRDCMNYLKSCLLSIKEQYIDDIEIIIVDDGSEAATVEKLTELSENDPSIILLNSHGIGPGGARNLALKYAKSDLVAFLDADDVWRPGKIRKQIDFHLENQDVVLSFSDYLHVDPDGNNYGTAFEFWRKDFTGPHGTGYARLPNAEATILSCNIVGTSTVMARLDPLRNANGFALSLPSASDWDLWLRLTQLGPVACSKEVTMDYLMRPGSVTRARGARIEAMETILSRFKDRSEPEIRQACRIAESNIQVARAEMAQEQGDLVGCLISYGKAFAGRPNKKIARAVAANLIHGCRDFMQPKAGTQ